MLPTSTLLALAPPEASYATAPEHIRGGIEPAMVVAYGDSGKPLSRLGTADDAALAVLGIVGFGSGLLQGSWIATVCLFIWAGLAVILFNKVGCLRRVGNWSSYLMGDFASTSAIVAQ